VARGERSREKRMRVKPMNKDLIGILGGSVLIIVGLVLAVFHKKIAYKTSDFYFRLLHIKFPERGYEIGFLVVGILFIILGILSAFKIIRFK
jgi:hypothetical protein